jgi:hypothetical protein
MRSFLYVVAFAMVVSTATASAQTAADFSTLRLKLGATIFVTDPETGIEVSGPLTSLTPADLSIDGRVFTPRRGLIVERSGDPIWMGAAIGFAAGAFALFPIIPETFVSQGGRIRINNGLVGGLVGALIDYAHRGRTTVYKGSSNSARRSVQRLAETHGATARRPETAAPQLEPGSPTLRTEVAHTIDVTDTAR